MKLHLSKKNTKLGKILSVSLTPIKSCVAGVPCVKKCYAMKAYRLRPNVREAWDENYEYALCDMLGFFQDIRAYLTKHNTIFFRWHVGGDIPNQRYLNFMSDLARDFQGVNFLAFTKNHSLDFSNVAQNLTIIASMWCGWGDDTLTLRKAWYQDGNETRVPSDALICSGACDKCGLCWQLPLIGKDVVFAAH